MPNLESLGVSGNDDEDDIPELEPAEEEGEVDETGVDPKDIELVMTQVCTLSDFFWRKTHSNLSRSTVLAPRPCEY